MALRVIVVLLSLVILPVITSAQESVKRSIFEDCDRARSDFSKLTVEQQSSLLDFFARVIALNTESPSAPEAYAVAPGSQLPSDTNILAAPRGADLIPGTLWQSMDAKRELRAKKCSLDLLDLAGPLSLGTLPSLVATYSEQGLSDEVAVNLEEVAASIAETAHVQGRTPEISQIEAIVPHALGQRTLVARNFIHEFRQEALPYIISLIAARKEQLQPEMHRYLLSLDPDGALMLRATINLLPGLTSEQIQHLLTTLPTPTVQAWPGFIKDLVQLSSDSNHSKIFTPVLGRACVAIGGVTADQPTQDRIAGIPDILSPAALSAENLACLMQSSPQLSHKAIERLCDSKEEDKRFLVQALSRGIEKSTPEIRSEAYSCLRRLALNPTSNVWRDSLLALAAFPERKTDTLAVAQQLSKSAAKSGDATHPQDLQQAVLELLQTIPLGKEYGRFSTLIAQSLRSGTSPSAALYLAKQAPAMDPTMLALALTAPPTAESLSVLSALSTRRDFSTKSVPPLIELLRYSEASFAAGNALLSVGKQSVTAIRKALPRLPSGTPRLSAIGLLVAFQAATKVEVYGLSKSLAELEDCTLIADRGELLCALRDYGAEDADINEHLARVTQRCLPSFKQDTLTKVVSCGPELLLKASDAVGAMCRSAGTDATRLSPVAELAAREISTESKISGPLVAQMLLNCPPAVQTKILGGLNGPRSVLPEIRDAISSLAIKQAPETKPAKELLRAIAYIGDTQYPWRDYIKQAIEDASHGTLGRDAADVIAVMPVDAVLAEVLPALESENSARLIGAALVGGALGAKAIPLVSRLWHLRTMRSPGVRYISSLALLQINPLTPDLHDSVKRTLVNRFFETAVAMPIRWSNTVAVNDLASGMFGTLRKERLQQLLATK
jgi:hypothetical protein